MSKSKVAGVPGTDPTLPRAEIKLGAESYYLCFNFGAIAIAQKSLRDIGVEVNLLHALDLSNMDAINLVPLLYAALITYQPKITLDKVTSLVTLKNLSIIFRGIGDAYVASLSEPSSEATPSDPNQAE